MTVWLAQWTVDVQGPDRMAAFWSAALGCDIERGEDGSAMLLPPAGAPPELGVPQPKDSAAGQ